MAAASAAQLVETAPLPPTAPWNVEYAPALCLLSRPFGEGADRVTLALSGDWVTDRFTLSVIGPQTGGVWRQGRIRLTFAPDTASTETAAESAPNVGLKSRVLTVRVEGNPIVNAKEVTLTPTSGDALPSAIRLAIGPMAKPWQAFQLCRADLAKKLGVDGDSLARIEQGPKALGNPSVFLERIIAPQQRRSVARWRCFSRWTQRANRPAATS